MQIRSKGEIMMSIEQRESLTGRKKTFLFCPTNCQNSHTNNLSFFFFFPENMVFIYLFITIAILTVGQMQRSILSYFEMLRSRKSAI